MWLCRTIITALKDSMTLQDNLIFGKQYQDNSYMIYKFHTSLAFAFSHLKRMLIIMNKL